MDKYTFQSTSGSREIRRRTLLKAGLGFMAGSAATLAMPNIARSQNVTLRILSSESSAASQAAINKAATEYERAFGVKVIVNTAPIDDAHHKILAAISAGTPYDIATQGYFSHVLSLANGGHIVPLTDRVKKHTWGPMGAWQFKGENWVYPYAYNLVSVYYRKDLYAKKGLRVPDTWEQLLENCKALTESDNGNIDRGGCVIPLASNGATNWATFGSLFADEPKLFDDKWNVILDRPDQSAIVERFLDLYAELFKTMPPGMNTVSYAELLSLFVTGKAAHSVYSGRLVETIEAKAPDLADKYGIFPSPPSMRGGKKALSYSFDGFVVFKSKQTEEALKFFDWFVENHYINWLHSAPMNLQPVRMDIYDDTRWRSHPMITKHWETMETMKSYLTDSNIVLKSIDSWGPSIDLLPTKVFDAYIMPEMLQNKVLRSMPSSECVKVAAERTRKLA